MTVQRAKFQLALFPGASGADVAMVQSMLIDLGFSIPAEERDARRYGAFTAMAVADWKAQRRLPEAPGLALEQLQQLTKEARELQRSVHGVVSLEDGAPVPGLTVTAIDRDFRAEQVLGEAKTDAEGRYLIGYRTADAVRAEKGTADLGIRVTAADGKTRLKSPTSRDLVMNAPADTRIDVTVSLPEGAVPAEFARIAAALKPLIGDVPFREIGANPQSDEAVFLARETGIDPAKLAHFIVAHRLEAESKVTAAYFYALLREDGLFGFAPERPRAQLTPVDLGSDTRAVLFEAVLLGDEPSHATLRRAVRKHLVPVVLLKQEREIRAQLQQWRKEAEAFVQQDLPRRILDIAGGLITDGKADDLLALLGPHDITDLPRLVANLTVEGKAPEAAAKLELGSLFGFHPGLVEEVSESLGTVTPEDLRRLAKLERKDWSDVLARSSVRLGGRPIEEHHARRQASAIVRRFETRFPTAAFAAQLARRKPKTLKHSRKVAAFFDAHPDFELGEHKLQPFLAAQEKAARLAPEALLELEALQRMFRLTGNYRKTEGLITAGYKSSASIVDAGKSRFIADARTAGLEAREAERVFATAENRNMAAMTVAIALRTGDVAALAEGEAGKALSKKIDKIIAEQPDLKSLFYSSDVCACEHCRSIFGPAAYFADIIRFLRNRQVWDTTLPIDTDIFDLLNRIRDNAPSPATPHELFEYAVSQIKDFLQISVWAASLVLRVVSVLGPKGKITLSTLLTEGDIFDPSIALTPDSVPTLYRGIRVAKHLADVKHYSGGDTRTAKDILFARRPDLGEIDLNCDNAEVPVPHIDIVCELLEEAVAPDAGFAFTGPVARGKASAAILTAIRAKGIDVADDALIYGPYASNQHFILRDPGLTMSIKGPGPNWILRRLRQTHGTAAERAAAPEYVNTAAYDVLALGVAAFDLPFDLAHMETRAFLSTAGVERADLMRALAVAGTPSAETIAGEDLRLAKAERTLIFAASANQPAIWGVKGPVASDSMKKLNIFTTRTGLDYAGVQSLLEGAFVRGGVNLYIRHLDSSCDLAEKEIIGLTDVVLDRMHRVLRLARHTGLSTSDIDRLAVAPKLGAGDLTGNALKALAALTRLAASLAVPVPLLITWLDTIPTRGKPSDHAKLFQTPAFTGQISELLTPENIAANEAVGAGGKTLADVAADLATAFGIKGAAMDAIIAHLAVLQGAQPLLSRVNLALAYARTGLARALGVKPEDELALERLTDLDPCASATTLQQFVDQAQRILALPVPLTELGYRLERRADNLALWDLAESAAGAAMIDLNKRLVAASVANSTPYDAAITVEEQMSNLEALLQKQPDLSAPGIAALCDVVRLATLTASQRDAAKVAVDDGLKGRVDAVAIKSLIDQIFADPAVEALRRTYLQALMQQLSNFAKREESIAAATTVLETLLRTAPGIAEAILRGARLKIGGVATSILGLLTSGTIAQNGADLSIGAVPDLYRALRVAHSVVGLIAPFKPEPKTVAFMFEKGAALGWLALDGLPFEGASPTNPGVAAADWLALADAFALIAEFPPVDVPGTPIDVPGILEATQSAITVFDLAATGGDKGALLDALALVTGWPRARLHEIDTRLQWTTASYRQPATWRAMQRTIERLNQLGTPMPEAIAYCADTLTAADSANARRLLRARYHPNDWLTALKAIMDPIRERKRDALVCYLLAANPHLTGKADLYDYFLTDTEWSPKMPSSRLVNAHQAVQVFIRRSLEGFEPRAAADLDNDSEGWKQWEWMKNYRVWEVNRKVFVHPQYYLKPQWRDDKTEAFAALEQFLMQNDMSDENVNAAFEGYLDWMDQTAFLDVLATCHDKDTGTLHIFAATKGGEPRVYYHRTLKNERFWTSWKKIDLDITGEHLVAFFRNKRLYLAWALFQEIGDDQQKAVYPSPASGVEQDMPKTVRWTEINLAVSEYTGKSWLPRRVSADTLPTLAKSFSLDQQDIVLTVSPDEDNFTVDVHQLLDHPRYLLIGSFLLTGCKAYPEAQNLIGVGGTLFFSPYFEDAPLRGQRFVEKYPRKIDTLAIATVGNGSSVQIIFDQTPGIFRVTYPLQEAEIDRFLTTLFSAVLGRVSDNLRFAIFGMFMPFFFEDNQRGYMLVPGFYSRYDTKTNSRKTVKTYSNIRLFFADILAFVTSYLAQLAEAKTDEERQSITAKAMADPEYAKLLEEFDSYSGIDFGILVRNLYHPLACFLRQRFFEGGIPKLLARSTQLKGSTQLKMGEFVFKDIYAPTPVIVEPYPVEEVEFGADDAYADVNWELFFHAPHMIATKLMEEDTIEAYDSAETWMRYIFDPRGSSNDDPPARYWNTKPFYQRSEADYRSQLISAILGAIAHDPHGSTATELIAAVEHWRNNPFKPYLVARSRTVAFQQAIVFLTVKLLIARGDTFFRRDQLEDLVQAGLDYSRAERLLGPRPKIVPTAADVPPETYDQLEERIDAFGNALCKIENLLPDLTVLPHGGAELPPLPLTFESLYFCIPPSEKLYELWDTLEERQFNLRNSRTIDGVERELSLFAPPLSVDALLQAAASGLSVSAILASLSAPRPPYRYRVMQRHAVELAEAAAGLSQRLEAALAARDGEGLQRLKAEHEGLLLKEQTEALKHEIAAADLTVLNATKGRDLHNATKAFYEGRPYMNEWEIAATVAYGASFALQAVMAIGYIAAGGLALIPKFMVGAAGFGGSPTANAQTGGDQISQGARDAMVGAISAVSGAFDKAGSMLSQQGSFLVREEDWKHSANTAGREAERADIEIKIANIRSAVARDQLRVHGIRRQQSAAEEAYLKSKFTNRELYDWLAGELRGLSRQVFNLAFAAGRAAERCWSFELGLVESFLRPGQWNSTRRGLLAADNLLADLRRMDNAYLQRNSREREITQHISLQRLDPIALIELRASGKCTVQMPEAVFDLDYPGHYFRRIKSLRLTVPCVTGPYTAIPLTVTQTSNRVRIKTGSGTATDAYSEVPGNDPRFHYNVGSIQSVSLSRGQDDAGLFNVNFDDERYLPFEGSGLIGTYVLELPAMRQIDSNAISDVVFTFSYTARDGGSGLRTLAATTLRERLNALALNAGRQGLFHAFDLRRDRPDFWHRLTTEGKAAITISADDLPYFTAGHAATVTASRLIAAVDSNPPYEIRVNNNKVTLTSGGQTLPGLLNSSLNGVAFAGNFEVEAPLPSMLRNLVLVVNYNLTT